MRQIKLYGTWYSVYRWHSIKDQLPERKQRVLISDGEMVTVASFSGIEEDIEWDWDVEGVSGYEWELDFIPRFWTEFPVSLPS